VGIIMCLSAAVFTPAALAMRAGGVAIAWVLHLFFLLLVGVTGAVLPNAMCPLYPPEVRTTGMNSGHQVSTPVTESGA
jgi:hypothetical protein